VRNLALRSLDIPLTAVIGIAGSRRERERNMHTIVKSKAWATTVSKTDPSWSNGQTSRYANASSDKEISSRDLWRKRDSSKNKERSSIHFFVLSSTKVGVITFLIPGPGLCLLSVKSCRRKQASGWSQLWRPLLGEKDERWLHRVTCETTKDKNQR
jgi:hypothetical protein